MRGLRVVLVLQLAFFAGWGALLLTSHRDAATVWLETAPVDPRDLLSGHYVALRYAIAAPDTGDCAALRAEAAGGQLFVALAPSGRTVATTQGPAALVEAVRCQATPPEPGAGVTWIVGTLAAPGGDGFTLQFGIERFYVPEDSPLRQARSGEVVAKVAIDDAFRPRLVALIGILRPTD
jgi:uncharacterized membrane-anchored protein